LSVKSFFPTRHSRISATASARSTSSRIDRVTATGYSESSAAKSARTQISTSDRRPPTRKNPMHSLLGELVARTRSLRGDLKFGIYRGANGSVRRSFFLMPSRASVSFP
jgi:hypothetical protein